MISLSARRFSLALVLGSTFLASAATAQSVVTGTDPCPPKLMCTAGQSANGTLASTSTTTASTTPKATTSSTSSASAAVQTLLVLLGIS